MAENNRICPRCKSTETIALDKKVYECSECGYLFKEYDDTEDVMLKLTECKSERVTDSRLCECMSGGVPKLGKLRTFGQGKLHITADAVAADSVTLTFHYRDPALNRTVTLVRGTVLEFSENGFDYTFFLWGGEL